MPPEEPPEEARAWRLDWGEEAPEQPPEVARAWQLDWGEEAPEKAPEVAMAIYGIKHIVEVFFDLFSENTNHKRECKGTPQL